LIWFLWEVCLSPDCITSRFFCKEKRTGHRCFFGIFCILMGLRVVLVGQVLFLRFFPHLPQELALKLEYFTFYLALPFFVLYMHYLFPQEISKKAAISYFLTGSAFSLHVLLTPSRVYSYYLIIFQVITVGFLFYLSLPYPVLLQILSLCFRLEAQPVFSLY